MNKSSPDSGYPGDVANGCDLYENLPFHGMAHKQPPHKQQVSRLVQILSFYLFLFVLFEFVFVFLKILAVHAIPVLVQEEDVVCPAPNTNATTTSSRPSSQLSQNGSSGYGSTRSQVGPFGTSNRPSPSSESSSAGESAPNTHNPIKKKNKSVWFMRGQRSGSAELRPPPAEAEVVAKTRGNPQYASLRIPNRIRRLSYEDRGLDLAEAEVDSDTEEKCYPLRHASSLEAQVNIFVSIFFTRTQLVIVLFSRVFTIGPIRLQLPQF